MQLNCDQSYHGIPAQHTNLSAESCFCVYLRRIPTPFCPFLSPAHSFFLSYTFFYGRSAINASETLVMVGEVTFTMVSENTFQIQY